jgi:hypothetical protein
LRHGGLHRRQFARKLVRVESYNIQHLSVVFKLELSATCNLLINYADGPYGRERMSSEKKLGRNRRPFVEDSSSPRPFDSSRGQNRGSISGFCPTGLPVGFHLYSGAASNCSKPQARSTPVVAARFGSAAISKAGSFSLALKCWKVTPSGLMGSWNRSPFFQS